MPVFPWGDLSSRCTNGNGTLDTEDLNGDNVLNASGAERERLPLRRQPAAGRQVLRPTGWRRKRWTVPSGWQLYRVPIRTPDATIGTPNLRLIQHLRMTVVAPPDAGAPDVVARFALARLRLVGSPWVRRADAPIAGISGRRPSPAAR